MRNKPRIRFKGFTGDWEQRKLGDVTNIKTGSRNQQDSVANGKYPFFIRSEKIEKLDEYDFDTEAILVPGDGRIGEIFHYYNGKFALHQRVYKVDDFKGVDAIYLLYLFQCKFKEHALRLNAQGTVPSLRLPMFTEWNIDIPSLQEQICIGRLLNKIELMITLHQRKLEKLKLAKKALLQKLFPKNGSQFPKIRFKGFTDAWEQRKLDELTISIGDGLHGTPKYDENGSYYFINGNNIVDSKVSVTEETKKVAFEALSNDDRRLDSTSILMSINGTIGTLARYNNENIMLGKSVAYITPKNINRDFLFYQLQGNVIQSYFYKNLTGTTIKNLGLGTIKNAIVMSTLSEEEPKIGQFFYKLDQYITLHQCKLDKLQDVKKGLLQKMFV